MSMPAAIQAAKSRHTYVNQQPDDTYKMWKSPKIPVSRGLIRVMDVNSVQEWEEADKHAFASHQHYKDANLPQRLNAPYVIAATKLDAQYCKKK